MAKNAILEGGGGGLSKSKLALATATEDTVFNGRTFYAGDTKELRTGTALSTQTDVAASNLFNGKKAYTNTGQLITGTALAQATTVTADNIPSGVTAYNQAGQLITGNGSGVFKYMKVYPSFAGNSTNSDLNKSYTYNADFKIYAVAFSGGDTNYGYSTQSNYSGYSNVPNGLLIGDQTQMVVSYRMAGSGSVAAAISKINDTTITVKCISAYINGSTHYFSATLYIIGI